MSSEFSCVQNSQCEVYVENTQNDINSVFNNLGMMYEKGEVPCSLDDDTESNFNGSIMDSEGVVAISKPADLEKFYREGNPPVNKVPIKRKHKHSPATSIDSTGTFVKQNDTSVDSKRQALEQPVPFSNIRGQPSHLSDCKSYTPLTERDYDDLIFRDEIEAIMRTHKIKGHAKRDILEFLMIMQNRLRPIRVNKEVKQTKELSKIPRNMEVNKQIEIKATYAKMLEKNAPKPVTNISFKGAISKKVSPPGPSKLASESTTTNLAQSKIVNNARSKSTLPTLIIKPANEEIKTSAMLKTALEGKIKLKDIQVEVLSCRPIQGNGIVVKTKTPEMLEKLKTTIMNDLTLRDKCQVYIPKPRVPHIIIFDIPPQDGDQAAHENNFILQLKESNELTDQEIKVVFKKKGRGSLQNWILAMQPKNYQEIKDKKRLRCGFNSFRFKEFLEPLRCFGCYRFGHLKRNCRETKPTCTKCTANHDPKGCTKPHPICRNCVLYNKSTNLKVRADHMSNSNLCPMYLREIEFIAKHTIYG